MTLDSSLARNDKSKKIIVVLLLIFIDQITKYLARTHLSTPIEVTEFFSLYLAFNTGVAFSLPVNRWLLIGVTLVFIGALVWELLFRELRNKKEERRNENSLIPSSVFLIPKAGLTLLLSGAIGNLIDRVWYGAVTDFLSFWSFPIFNVADSLITVGVILIIWGEVFGAKMKDEKTL